MTATLVLKGHCPSKKNLWKRGRGGRTYIDDETAALTKELDDITRNDRSRGREGGPDLLLAPGPLPIPRSRAEGRGGPATDAEGEAIQSDTPSASIDPC